MLDSYSHHSLLELHVVSGLISYLNIKTVGVFNHHFKNTVD